jgi:hypothetical protein
MWTKGVFGGICRALHFYYSLFLADNKYSLSKVHIGSVSGSIYNSITADRDVTNATITIGNNTTKVKKFHRANLLKILNLRELFQHPLFVNCFHKKKTLTKIMLD